MKTGSGQSRTQITDKYRGVTWRLESNLGGSCFLSGFSLVIDSPRSCDPLSCTLHQNIVGVLCSLVLPFSLYCLFCLFVCLFIVTNNVLVFTSFSLVLYSYLSHKKPHPPSVFFPIQIFSQPFTYWHVKINRRITVDENVFLPLCVGERDGKRAHWLTHLIIKTPQWDIYLYLHSTAGQLRLGEA